MFSLLLLTTLMVFSLWKLIIECVRYAVAKRAVKLTFNLWAHSILVALWLNVLIGVVK